MQGFIVGSEIKRIGPDPLSRAHTYQHGSTGLLGARNILGYPSYMGGEGTRRTVDDPQHADRNCLNALRA